MIGNSTAVPSYPRYVRLTFSQTGINNNYVSNLAVRSIRFYAQNCWGAVSSVGTTGTPYTYDENQLVRFSNSIYTPAVVYTSQITP